MLHDNREPTAHFEAEFLWLSVDDSRRYLLGSSRLEEQCVERRQRCYLPFILYATHTGKRVKRDRLCFCFQLTKYRLLAKKRPRDDLNWEGRKLLQADAMPFSSPYQHLILGRELGRDCDALEMGDIIS